MTENTVILSLGGALIVPEKGIDTNFLKDFEVFVRKEVAKGRRFFIVCGGGRTARLYRDAGSAVIGKITPDDLDWLGIHATRLNAHLLRTIFRDIAHPKIIMRYDKKIEVKEPVCVAAGWKPGWSTDYCATLLANLYGAKTLINMSNIDMVCTKDPRKFKDAKPIEKTSWNYFQSLVGDKWNPGMNVPFDPIATKNAAKTELTVIVLRGSNIPNMEKVFEGKKFVGTVISPLKVDASFFDREYFENGILYKRFGYTTSLVGRVKSHVANFYRALVIKIFLKPKKLLDVGCATGRMIKYLRILGVEAYGIELSDYALSKAIPEVKQFITKGDILNLPYKEEDFDTVTSFNVLEHLEKDNLIKAIEECNRVAKKYTLHKVFTQENKWIHWHRGNDLSCASVFSREWWREFFLKNKFKLRTKFFPYLPKFMETIFILEKNKI